MTQPRRRMSDGTDRGAAMRCPECGSNSYHFLHIDERETMHVSCVGCGKQYTTTGEPYNYNTLASDWDKSDPTGGPSPDIAALREVAPEFEAAMAEAPEPLEFITRAERVSLLARLTAAERDAERMRRDVQRAFNTADALANALTQDSDSGDFGRALEERAQAACKLFAQLARLRAALPPAGDTRGEQQAQEQD